MGIRIKKHLCYALDNVVTDEKTSRLVDSRFSNWMLRENGEYDEAYDRVREMFVPFLEWIRDETKISEHKKILAQANGPSESDMSSVDWGIYQYAKDFLDLPEKEKEYKLEQMFHLDFVYCGEYGLPNVFGIIPPHIKQFYRYDDMIDYYEAGCSADSKVQWLDQRTGRCGIYPHNMMIRIPHKEKIKIVKENLISDLPYSMTNLEFLPDRIGPGEFNRLIGVFSEDMKASLCNTDIEKAKEVYRPEIDGSIILWTHYVGLFTDWAKTVNELRPCIYTYWS